MDQQHDGAKRIGISLPADRLNGLDELARRASVAYGVEIGRSQAVSILIQRALEKGEFPFAPPSTPATSPA